MLLAEASRFLEQETTLLLAKRRSRLPAGAGRTLEPQNSHFASSVFYESTICGERRELRREFITTCFSLDCGVRMGQDFIGP
jgi:hypothetical protein